MRPLTFCVLVFLASRPVNAFADIVVEAEHKTAAMGKKPTYRFVLQKGSFRSGGYTVWGKIVDAENKPVRDSLTIVFTAFAPDGKFIGRANTQIGRSDSGGVGEIDDLTINTDSAYPATVLWRVVTKSDAFKGLKVEESTDKTSGDVPLQFEVQKIGKGYSGLRIYGKIKNSTKKEFKNIAVIVSAFDADGKLIARGRTSANPGTIQANQVSYIDDLNLDTGTQSPAKLVWKVVESRY